MDKVTLFKFGKSIDYSKSHPTVKKYTPQRPKKGCGLGHVIIFGMMPRFLNFANASTVANATRGVKKFPRNGCGIGHMTAV